MQYDFEWDPNKAKANIKKHGVSFEQAAEVFLDPNALSVLDRDHSESEERWVTLGMGGGVLLIVCHGFHDDIDGTARARIFSARRATRRESQRYKESL